METAKADLPASDILTSFTFCSTFPGPTLNLTQMQNVEQASRPDMTELFFLELFLRKLFHKCSSIGHFIIYWQETQPYYWSHITLFHDSGLLDKLWNAFHFNYFPCAVTLVNSSWTQSLLFSKNNCAWQDCATSSAELEWQTRLWKGSLACFGTCTCLDWQWWCIM